LLIALACGIMRLTVIRLGEGSRMAKLEDPKVLALLAERSLNPRPERVLDEGFLASDFFDARDLVQVKYELVRRVQVDGWSVTRAVAAFGFSRPSFYDAAASLQAAGLPGLLAERPGPKRAHKLDAQVVAFVLEQLAAGAAERPRELVAEIEARYGVRVHPRSVERAVMRARAPKSGER
jgi:transposase